MKIILTSILLVLIIPITSTSQIVVEPYEKQIRINVNELASLPMLRASAKSGEVKVVYSDQIFSGGCLGTLVRTYEFSDAEGNKTTADLYVNLEDTDAPVFSNVPVDITVSEGAMPVVVSPQVTDNSKTQVEVTFSENREKNIITRIWVAIDVCGNQSIVSQRITVKGK